MDDEATCETSPSSRGRRLTGLNVAEDVPLRTTPVMLRGGRSREPLSRQGLTWDEFLDELEQIERDVRGSPTSLLDVAVPPVELFDVGKLLRDPPRILTIFFSGSLSEYIESSMT